MTRKKRIYYYDTETCQYEPVKHTAKSLLPKIGIWLVFAALVVVGSKVAFDNYFIQFKTAELHEKRAKLRDRLDTINNTLAWHQKDLSDLKENVNNFYSAVADESQISESYWKGGRGGSPIYGSSNDVSKTQIEIENIGHQIQLLSKSLTKVHFKVSRKEDELANLPSIKPVEGNLISGFGNRRHPVTGGIKFHEGLDFACGTGTPIYATANGVIETTGYVGNGYGLNINIDHKNGFKTKFAHMSKSLVKEGQKVTRGQLIGYSGNTGLSTGPHLHYEIMYMGVKIDPFDYFYEDLPPSEYRRLKLNKSTATPEKVNKALDNPPMD